MLNPFADNSSPRVTVITIFGKISSTDNVSFKNAKNQVDRAFSQLNLVAVCLIVDSPGGSAVQSHLIAEYIRGKATKQNIPVFGFVEDRAASGGYLVACAADLIFVSRFSMVGSIGVVMTSFSLTQAMKKIGVESKVFTAGSRKGGLNPLLETSEQEENDIEKLLFETHKEFIDFVKERRMGKLKEEESEDLFSGAVFGAQRALSLGLVDDLYTVMEDKVAELLKMDKLKMVAFNVEEKSGLPGFLGLTSPRQKFFETFLRKMMDFFSDGVNTFISFK